MTQTEIILKTLLNAKGEWVPVTRFLEQYITRTAARILDIKNLGYEVESRRVEGKTFNEYRIPLKVPVQQTLI